MIQSRYLKRWSVLGSLGVVVCTTVNAGFAQVTSSAFYTARTSCHRTEPNTRCDAIRMLTPVQCACDYVRQVVINGNPVTIQSVARSLTSGGSVPMGDAHASLQASGITTASANVTYGIYVFPRTPSAAGRDVPLLVRIRGSADASSARRAGDSATATADVSVCGGSPEQCVRASASTGCPMGQDCLGPRTFDITGLIVLRVQEFGASAFAHVLASVSLTAGASSDQDDLMGRVEGEALADPVAEIDPTYPFRDEYFIVQSRNLYCPADFDNGSGLGSPDGGVTIDDLLFYLVAYDSGSSVADLDDGSATGTPDGGVTIDDLLYYLSRYAAGC